MRNKDDDVGYWAGWIIAFGIAAGVFIFAVWQGPSLQAVACRPAEPDCFRQWVTALGGWATIVVAIPSLLFLSKQIRDADRHHRRSTALTVRRLRSLAANVSSSAKTASGIAMHWMTIFGGAKGGKIPLLNERTELVVHLDQAVLLLSDKHFAAFEREIYLPLDHATFLCGELVAIKADVTKHPEVLNREQALAIARRLHEAHALIKRYMDDVANAADEFLGETREYASLRN